MAENTTIEWADHTFNPWTGCTKVSPGCDHCYAESWSKRSGTVQWGPDQPRRRTTAANWRLPLKWNAQAEREGRRFRVFCASLADVFDNAVPPEWRRDLFDLIRSTPCLDWLLLTKRIGNVTTMVMEANVAGFLDNEGFRSGLPANVWLGATVVNQAEADRDVPKLLQVPARVRFLSIEPMLGPIDLCKHLWQCCERWEYQDYGCYGHRPECCGSPVERDLLHWVICGGESGPYARPMHPEWARSLRDQCIGAGVPFLFKQHGEWAEQDGHKPTRTFRMDTDVGETMAARCDGFISLAGEFVRDMDDATTDDPYRGLVRIGKKAAGRQLDGRTHDGFPT